MNGSMPCMSTYRLPLHADASVARAVAPQNSNPGPWQTRAKLHLCESSHSKEAMHGSGALISVHCPQLRIPQRQVPVAVLLVLVHCNVEGAVHGAKLVQFLLNLDALKHVFSIEVQMAGGLPHLCFGHMRRVQQLVAIF